MTQQLAEEPQPQEEWDALPAEAPDSEWVDAIPLLIPVHRSNVNQIKAVKYTESELAKLGKFQEWLSITINPVTGEPFIPQNTYAAMVHFCLNYTFEKMGQLAQELAEARKRGGV